MSGIVGTSSPAKACEWCGRAATTTREVRPGVRGGVCHSHDAMIDRNLETAELQKRRRTLERRLPGRVGNDRDADVSELERVNRRLGELGHG